MVTNVPRPTTSRLRVIRVRFAAAVAALLVAAALAGCAAAGGAAEEDVWVPLSFSGPVPDFSGPWASEFAEAYRSTTSEVVHTILAKGSITDEDYAGVSRDYVACMSDRGFTAVVTGPFGEGTAEGEGDVNAANQACSGDLSVISAVRFSTLPTSALSR